VIKRFFLAIAVLLLGLVLFRVVQFFQASSIAEPQAYLVLGGAPQREVFVTTLKKQYPDRYVLISGGSADPCLYLMFQKHDCPMDKVWTEHCSKDTFGNFFYSLPILESWGIRKVAVVTDYPQLKRAMPLAHILFASHGMSVELKQSPIRMGDERGTLETIGLAVMGCGWGIASQFFQPHCSELVKLSDVDMNYWNNAGYECQQQTGIKSHPQPK
jgi:uncharacterized SAM-binding protein YcdF (DUF218 family)